jgi:hypothetical protein
VKKQKKRKTLPHEVPIGAPPDIAQAGVTPKKSEQTASRCMVAHLHVERRFSPSVFFFLLFNAAQAKKEEERYIYIKTMRHYFWYEN